MPYRQKKLDEVLDALHTRKKTIKESLLEVNEILEILHGINDETYMVGNKERTRKPIDKGLGLQITDERRDGVFDVNVQKALSIINKRI